MKRITFYICIVLLGLFLISCNHESSDISEESAKVATVQFSLNTNVRTVLPQTVDASDLSNLIVQVQKNGYTRLEKSFTTLDDFLSANISLDVGTWTFTLTAKKGGTTYFASTTTEIVYGYNLINFGLSISDMGNGKGSFSLTLDFSEANNADKVTSAKCSIQTMYGSAVSGFSQTSVSVQNESVTYSLNSLPVGNYRVFITLLSNDLELITWREIVVVSSDLQSTATQKLKSLNLYHISYVLNDDEENPASFTETTTETYTRNTDSFDLAMLSRNAYSFEGWYDDREFSGEPITILDTSRAEDVTLYAKWIPIEYSITYNLNGGTFDTEYPENFDISKRVALVNPIRNGYTFEGWHFKEDFSDDSVSEIPLGSSESKVLYAKWNLIKYTITYNLNSGQFDSESPGLYTIESDTFELIKPSREHYVFEGWYEDKECTKTPVKKIQKGSVGNIILYAKWDLYEYSITYYLNGGSFNSEYAHSYNITDSVALITPVFEGHEFLGWYTNESFEGESFSEIPSGSFGNKKFYARWKWQDFTITYELNGGIFNSNCTEKYNVETETISLLHPMKEGFLFEGWYTNNSFDGDIVSEIPKGSHKNITLYAKWRYESYSINYSLGDGEFLTQVPNEYRESIDLQDVIPYSKKEVFKGWYLESSLSGENIIQLDGFINRDVTLYAAWEKPSAGDVVVENGWIVKAQNYTEAFGEPIAVLFIAHGQYLGLGIYNSGEIKYAWGPGSASEYINQYYNTGHSVEVVCYSDIIQNPIPSPNVYGDDDGGDNWAYICSSGHYSDSSISLFPIFLYARNYSSLVSSNSYKTGWYVPSGCELKEIYNQKNLLNNSLSIIGGMSLINTYYWSSSELESVAFGANVLDRSKQPNCCFALNLENGYCLWSTSASRDSKYSVCCIRKFDF